MRPQGRHEAGGQGGVVEQASSAMYRRPRRQALLLAMLCRLLCPHLQAGPSCPTLFTVSEPSVPRSWPFSEPIPRGFWRGVDSVPVPARPHFQPGPSRLRSKAGSHRRPSGLCLRPPGGWGLVISYSFLRYLFTCPRGEVWEEGTLSSLSDACKGPTGCEAPSGLREGG